MTAGQDEFLGLYVVVSENPRRCEYVVRSVGGKPIQAIQWQSPPASTHVLYINGRSIGKFQIDEAFSKNEVKLAPRFLFLPIAGHGRYLLIK